MVEEFHGTNYPEGPFKLLYGWGILNTKVWMPSLSELVGIDPNNYADWSGTYLSAMQGLNISGDPHVMEQGGTQFAYFRQYNASGGGTMLWNTCAQEETWLRSTYCVVNYASWRTTNMQRVDAVSVTASHAVHPAALGKAGIKHRHSF